MRISSVAVLAMLVVACGGDSGPAKIEAEGSWSGPVHDNSGATIGQLALTLVETSGSVTGSGNISGTGVAEALDATGSYSAPSLSLNLTSPGFNTINLTAVVAETQMTGTLSGSGFVNAAIALARQ